MPEPWLIMLMPYFGRWPEWIDLFIESCKWNPDVHWRFFTDCGQPENEAANVEFVPISFAEYRARVRERLGIAFDPVRARKLCDARPAFGFIHEQEISDFPFFGYGDIDVIYGTIRNFYSEAVRAKYNLLSTHADILAGHFAVLRNSPENREAFREIAGFADLLRDPRNLFVDELRFTDALVPPYDDLQSRERRGQLFVERYSTVLSPRGWHDGSMNYPARWFWREGRLTNDRDGDREFLYLHFMRWKALYPMREEPPAAEEGAWCSLDRLVHVDWRRAAREGYCISRAGFTPIGA